MVGPVTRSTPATSSRVDWVDAAKGIAIIMVALAHAVQWTTLTGIAPDIWNRINLLFVVFRMPLFFLASGLFAASVIARSWRELWRSRLSLLVWALLLWTIIRFAFFTAVPDPSGLDETSLTALLLAPVRPSNGLWFLYALTIFFVVTKLLRDRVDWRIQLAGAAILSALFFARADTGNIAWNGIGRYFVFFIIGCLFRDQIIRFVERRGLLSGVLIGLAFVLSAVGIIALSSRATWVTGALIFVSVLAVAAGLIVARFLSGFGRMSWLSYIGRNTLPVYVLHVMIVSAVTSVLLLWDGTGWLAALGPILPVVVAGVAVAVSLGIWRLTRDLPVLRYGYAVPSWFSGRRAKTGAPDAVARDDRRSGQHASPGPREHE